MAKFRTGLELEDRLKTILERIGCAITEDPDLDHAWKIDFVVTRFPQIPSIGAWGGPGGNTSERRDSQVPHVRGILDENGRIMVLMTHNTDFGDAFEREGEDHQYFLAFAPDGYAFGVNAIIYSMTH